MGQLDPTEVLDLHVENVTLFNSPLAQESAPGQTVQRDEMLKEDEEPVQAKLETGAIQREEMPPEEEEELPVQASLETGAIQREEMPPEEEEEEEPVQAKLMVQRKSEVGGTAATPDLENSIESASSGGQSLSENIIEPMEKAFEADFSGVKVHTDARSHDLNQSIQARAFTTGQDIFFREGQYDPGSKGGQELLAHELTHVMQQNGGAVQRQKTLEAANVFFSKKDDVRQIESVAKEYKMTPEQRREFGDFVEEQKDMGNLGSKNERGDFTYQELRELAREFLGQ